MTTTMALDLALAIDARNPLDSIFKDYADIFFWLMVVAMVVGGIWMLVSRGDKEDEFKR